MSTVRNERGRAILEFQFLGVLLLIPLVYVLLTVLDVQRSSYAVTQAAREAGRLYVATGNEQAARLAANVALDDQGLTPDGVSVTFWCSPAPCYRPGAEVTVLVRTEVALPFVPDFLAGSVNAHIPVQATHVATVDQYRELS